MIPVILAAAVGLASATGAWLYQENRYEAILAEREATHATELAKATANALAETVRLQKAKDEAERKHQGRVDALSRDLARTRSVADGLRGDLEAARVAVPGASCGSLRAHAATLNAIFSECTAEAERLAESADRHALDALMLKQAWPVK